MLREVDHGVTLAGFVAGEKDPKLAAIADAALLLDAVTNATRKTAPDDAQIVQALAATARALDDAQSFASPAVAASAARLAGALRRLAQGTPAERERASQILMPGFVVMLDQMRSAFAAKPVTVKTLPADLIRDWIGIDGRARIEVFPRADVNDSATLSRFVAAVKRVAPDATGAPVSIEESGRTIVHAFV